nr:MAG TPA: hypothetical protein [Caudoviricetes sp.]
MDCFALISFNIWGDFPFIQKSKLVKYPLSEYEICSFIY